MSVVQSWVDRFAAQASALPGARLPWLASMRQRAIDRFAAEGWPTTRQESWHHTSLAALEALTFGAGALQDAASQLRQLRQDGAGTWLVFVDGRHAVALSDVGDLPQGVHIDSVANVLEASPDSLEPLFGDETLGASPAALNAALAADGAFVHLGRGAVLDEPVHLVFIASAESAASFTRNFIRAETGAQATIVEHYVGQGAEASLTNTVTRVQLDPDARVTHMKLQQESGSAFHLGAADIEQQRGSYYASHSLSFGARLARHDIVTRLQGEGAETLLNGLYYVDGRRHVDHHTFIDHATPHCSSREFYRGILADTARGVFGGRILVAEGADKTDAVQRSDSLLLSRLARSDARPELEIYADDVKCAHGATVGQIDENSLFYLRSRGLDDTRARSILTYGFAAQALDRIELEALRHRGALAIKALLPGGTSLGELE